VGVLTPVEDHVVPLGQIKSSICGGRKKSGGDHADEGRNSETHNQQSNDCTGFANETEVVSYGWKSKERGGNVSSGDNFQQEMQVLLYVPEIRWAKEKKQHILPLLTVAFVIRSPRFHPYVKIYNQRAISPEFKVSGSLRGSNAQ
jgi:hypothetical protein